MQDTTPSPQPSTDQALHPPAPDRQLAELSELMADLDDRVELGDDPRAERRFDHQNKLAQVRLGVAGGLFSALRAKHTPTAAHCMRVALGCSSWALSLDLTEQERDEIEVAALLHDVGKVGVPDYILAKPGKLTPEEAVAMDGHRAFGEQILRNCCASPGVIDIVKYAAAWYDGAREGFDLAGEDLPLGARVVAIVDAFDAMTTDQVYRRAKSRERAVAELFECAGAQFDPQLVKSFCDLLQGDRVRLTPGVARRWLEELQPQASNRFWRLNAAAAGEASEGVGLFHANLFDSMHDAVAFVDCSLQILLWNRAAERMTGIPASSICQKKWTPALIDMHDDRSEPVAESDCPAVQAIRTGEQQVQRFVVASRSGKEVTVDATLTPVIGRDGATRGAIIVLHDASNQISLEERVQTLHEKAIRDPLTQVANRAEFDRVHEQYVEAHLERKLPCSLIVSDLDHFKEVNDTYGHQAGDEALVSFANLLKRSCRTGDLVARYGGEEFVMVCADCDNATATERAEEIRAEWANIRHPGLEHKTISASFGVTEVQNGDTPETMLRRADRALYQAKELGRNTVVQLGAGLSGEEPPASAGWLGWFGKAPPDQVLARTLVTAVPLKIAAEKLRGFVADHHAEIVRIEDNHAILQIDGQHAPLVRRATDRPAPFFVELKFEETAVGDEGSQVKRTLVHVTIRPKRNRDRRRRDVVERARQLFLSLKSYLMAHDHGASRQLEQAAPAEAGVLQRAGRAIASWLR